ncbi:MAG: hypothetical protein M1524_04230 [Patescibacteria group bacterium]|nr:hypothetical protein [Patescibacteria group bacterium]
MSRFLIWVLLFIATLLQGAIISLPIMLSILLLLYVKKRDVSVFLMAIIFGIVIDIFSVRNIGQSSIYLISFLFIAAIYEKKFEIDTLPFVLIFSFLGSLGYLWIFGFSNIVIIAIINSLITGLFFLLLNRVSTKNVNRLINI